MSSPVVCQIFRQIEVSKVRSVENPLLPMGWALRSSQVKRTRFTANQKDYLTKKFDLGEISGRKSDPESDLLQGL